MTDARPAQMQPERHTETMPLAQPTPSTVYIYPFVNLEKKVSDESISESFFNAKPL